MKIDRYQEEQSGNCEISPQKNVRGAIRVTISLNPTVLELIDNVAFKLGMTRSGFIALAAREYSKSIIN